MKLYPNKDMIPPRFKDSIDRYVELGVPTGGFLEAVLSNDLFEAVGRADGEALENIPHIVAYVYNNIPSGAHGSHKRVKDWLHEKHVQREAAREAKE